MQLAIRLCLVLDRIFGHLVDQTEFWTDPEDKVEHLSSLDKFMQIRLEFGLRTKSDLFYQVTQCQSVKHIHLRGIITG